MKKIYYAPVVKLISKSHIKLNELNEFLEGNTDKKKECEILRNFVKEEETDTIPEIAGRICYMSFDSPRPGGNKAYLDHVKEVGHGSVLEHSSFGFIFYGVSRSLTHELVRHRVGNSFSQSSQRFVDESDSEIVVPPELKNEVSAYILTMECKADVSLEEVHKNSFLKDESFEKFKEVVNVGRLFMHCMDTTQYSYKFISDYLTNRDKGKGDKTTVRKSARGTARSVLPNATETKILVTGNGRSWRHFMELRGSLGADIEIRLLAIEVLKKLKEASPNLFSDMNVVENEKGEQYICSENPKV